MEVLLEHEDVVLEAAAQVLGDGEVEVERAVGHGEAGDRLCRAQHTAHAAGEPLVQLVVVLHDGGALDRIRCCTSSRQIQSLVAMAAPRSRVSGAWERRKR